MTDFCTDLRTKKGEPVLPYGHIELFRGSEKLDPLKIMPQRGCQEKFLASNADITIFGGNRGPGKTFSLLMEALRDITDKDFNAVILRAEKGDFKGIIEKSSRLYSQFGTYNRSQNDMTWNFDKGGKLFLTYFSDPIDDFKKRFQGQEYAYIGIDEITHISYDKFKYILTDNRNSHGIRNRLYGTCNPDPDSWVRKFIDWWIGPDGLPLEERDGVLRYCFMDGNSPDSIFWGASPEEVYAQCREIIDSLWNPKFGELGFDKISMFVKSVTFIKGKLEENVILLKSDPNYLANLAQQDEEQRARDLEGNWNFKNAGDDMIKMADMERFFAAPYNLDDQKRRATCDIAFTGGDSLVLWLWVGWHVEDIFVCRDDAKTTLSVVKSKLREWGVLEEDFTYDLNGIGQTFKGFFPKAVPFNNLEAPVPADPSEKDGIKAVYANVKSQCAYLFAKKLIRGEVSINEDLLSMPFSGDGFDKWPLRRVLMQERKCVRKNEDSADKGFSLIQKKLMRRYVGHSPDYFESLIMRYIFELKKSIHHKPKGLGWL